MLEIKLIDQEHQADIRLKNEPFSLWGKCCRLIMRATGSTRSVNLHLKTFRRCVSQMKIIAMMK